jgi:ribose-phosphate pyrophosphokinase
VIVDDMISTGGTIAAAIKVVLENGATARMCVAATHALFTGNVDERLATYPIEHIFVSDSVPSPTLRTLSIKTVSLGESIAIRIEAVCKGQID